MKKTQKNPIENKKILVITGSRAEYGLLKKLMHEIKVHKFMQLQIIATGMHLDKNYGLTVNEILEDGFSIDYKIKMHGFPNTSHGLGLSASEELKKISRAIGRLKPDICILLGDRYEIFVGAFAALLHRVPIAHIHGGEITEGAFDDAIRHSITKMSHLHFVATETYRERVIQMGEMPKTVFNVGGMGIDAIKHTSLYKKTYLEKKLNFRFNKKNLLITFHPVTLEKNSSKKFIVELLGALRTLQETKLIFTLPNSDVESDIIFNQILKFSKTNKNTVIFKSVGQKNYFSLLNQVDGVIGNSSSGLLEAPSFQLGTVNIGARQEGRIKASSVIDCDPNSDEILNAIQTLYTEKFQKKLTSCINPYGRGGASQKIINILKKTHFKNLLLKKFNTLNT